MVHSAGCWLSLLHLISIFSGTQFIRASRGPLRPGVAFPTTSLSNSTACNSTGSSNSTQLNWPSNSTELYNLSTPTRSLKSNVLSLSGGNNCHAVQRSLSSGASLCSGTVGPSPCPILSALIRPRDLFRLLAIGMCHFLPVHHLGIAFLGRVEGSKYN